MIRETVEAEIVVLSIGFNASATSLVDIPRKNTLQTTSSTALLASLIPCEDARFKDSLFSNEGR